MARDEYAWIYPMEPTQFANNSGLRRGEPSGEIFCPVKLAHIGVMRCGEYQSSLGCGSTCTAKANAEDLARARAEILNLDGDKGGKRSWICRQCGGPKKWFYSEICMNCREPVKRSPYQVANKGRSW